MPRPAVTRYPPNHRPQPADHVRYGVPAIQLVAMVKAEAAFNAAAMAEAWEFEPPTSTPVPFVDIPRDRALARIGAWSRRLDAKQAARRAPRIDFEASAAAAGELNAPQTYSHSSQEIASAIPRAKSMPWRNPWGKRHFTPGKDRQARSPRSAGALGGPP
jgi:hypothetical protein